MDLRDFQKLFAELDEVEEKFRSKPTPRLAMLRATARLRADARVCTRRFTEYDESSYARFRKVQSGVHSLRMLNFWETFLPDAVMAVSILAVKNKLGRQARLAALRADPGWRLMAEVRKERWNLESAGLLRPRTVRQVRVPSHLRAGRRIPEYTRLVGREFLRDLPWEEPFFCTVQLVRELLGPGGETFFAHGGWSKRNADRSLA